MDIKLKVAEKINSSNELVINTVVDKLAEIEISKRVDIITNAINKQDQLEKEYKKIEGKNDNISYVNGEKVESMSEKRFNEIKKSKEQLDNFIKAFNIALETNTQESYTKLNGLLGGNKTEGSEKSQSESPKNNN